MSLMVALLLFLVGAVLAIFATERLLEGLVSLALLLTPVRVEPQVMWLDWPALLIVTCSPRRSCGTGASVEAQEDCSSWLTRPTLRCTSCFADEANAPAST